MGIEEEFKKNSKEYGEQQLSSYRQRVNERYNKLLEKRNSFTNKAEGFQFQLIAIAGGTITLFLALQTDDSVSLFIKIGFAILGVSLLFGVTSLFFGLESKQFEIFTDEETNNFAQNLDLDFIEKFGYQNITFDKQILQEKEKLTKNYKDKLQHRQRIMNKILGLIHLNGQRVEDGQVILFLIAILFLIIGIFR